MTQDEIKKAVFPAYIQQLRPIIDQFRRWATLTTSGVSPTTDEDLVIRSNPMLAQVFKSAGEIIVSIFDNVYSRLTTFPSVSKRDGAHLRWNFVIALIYYLYRVVLRVEFIEQERLEEEYKKTSELFSRLRALRLRLEGYIKTLFPMGWDEKEKRRIADSEWFREWMSNDGHNGQPRQIFLYKEVVPNTTNASRNPSPKRLKKDIDDLYVRARGWATQDLQARNVVLMAAFLYQAIDDAEIGLGEYARMIHKLLEIFSDALFPTEKQKYVLQDLFKFSKLFFKEYESFLTAPAINGL